MHPTLIQKTYVSTVTTMDQLTYTKSTHMHKLSTITEVNKIRGEMINHRQGTGESIIPSLKFQSLSWPLSFVQT